MSQRCRDHVAENVFLSVPMRLRTNEFRSIALLIVFRCSKKRVAKKGDVVQARQLLCGTVRDRSQQEICCASSFPSLCPPPRDRVCVLGFSQFPVSFCVVCLFFVVSFVSFVPFVPFVSFVLFVSFVPFVSFVTFGSFGSSCALGFEIRCVVIVAAFLFC